MDDPMRETLQALVTDAQDKLQQAEAVAALVPRLRRQLRVLERSLDQLDDATTERADTDATIAESIVAAIRSKGGQIKFKPRGMTAAVHGLVGGNKTSLQVELHRLENNGVITVDRDQQGRPVQIKVAPERHLAAL